MSTFIRLLAVVSAIVLPAASLASATEREAPRAGPRLAEPRVAGREPDGRARSFRPSHVVADAPRRPALRPADADDRAGRRSPSGGPAAPLVLDGFDGIGDIDGTTPADPTGALGDSWYFTAINVSWALFDRAGATVLGPESLTAIDPSLSGAFSFDPKVVYDQYNDTFVLVFLILDTSPRASRIVVTTIPDATATDVATWCTTIVQGDLLAGDGDQFADYPGLGYTADRVTITTNQFSFSNKFRYAQILSFEKTELYDCSIPKPQVDVLTGSRTQNRDGSLAFTLQPAQTVGGVAGDQFLLSFEPRGRKSFLTLWRVREGKSGLILKKVTIPTGRTKIPFLAAQAAPDPTDPDLFWDAGDFRLINSFYDSDTNRLYAAHTIRKNFKPNIDFKGYIEAAARWYEIAPAARLRSSTVLRRGVIGGSEVEIGWPVVATDDAGNVFVTYNRASPTLDEFISAWIAEIPPGSSSPSETLLAPGQGVYDVRNGPERWGDYSAIGRDPLDGAVVFAINQYATASNAFQQSVHLVRHG